jgi:hypothetical protein
VGTILVQFSNYQISFVSNLPLSYLYLSIDKASALFTVADLLFNSTMANKMTGYTQQLNRTIDSVAFSCENFIIEMGQTFKCSRDQFNQTTLHRKDVSKATLCKFLANCCGFLFPNRRLEDKLIICVVILMDNITW